MKKTALLFVLLISISFAFAQKSKVTSALSYKETGKLDKAYESIEAAIDANNPKNESSIPWPRTWEVRGEIHQAIYQSKDENIKKLSTDPLTVAFDSYMKAIELDLKGSFSKSIKIKLTLLISDLTNQAIESFKTEDFAKSQRSFEQILSIEGTKVYNSDDPNAIDTAIVFNAGLAAFEAKNYDKAIEHYKNAAKYKYNGARTYQLISNSYIQKKDTVLALKALEDGLKEFPGNGGILIDVINIYINGNKVDEALKYLDIAIEKDPKNPSYHFAKGAMYDKMQNNSAAIECYLKAIEYKEDYFDALFNLGAIYYNLGVKQVDVANAVPSNQAEKYEAEKEKADVEFRKALPYMEKASVINPTDKFTLESLKTLYYRLKMMDKHAEIVEKLKSL